MLPSDECIALIERFEGCVLKAYRDAVGVPTIGFGHTRGVTIGDEITQKKADEYLALDVEEHANGVLDLLLVKVTQPQFDALVSFAFNLGVNNLKHSTLLRKVNDGDIEGAAHEFGKWINAGGKPLAGLLRRRAAECELFLTEESDE